MPKITECPTLKELVNIWLVFAGDGETYLEIYKHLQNCETCQANKIKFEAWRKERELQSLSQNSSLA